MSSATDPQAYLDDHFEMWRMHLCRADVRIGEILDTTQDPEVIRKIVVTATEILGAKVPQAKTEQAPPMVAFVINRAEPRPSLPAEIVDAEISPQLRTAAEQVNWEVDG